MVDLLPQTEINLKKLEKALKDNFSRFKVVLYGQVYDNISNKEIIINGKDIDLILPRITVYLKKYECCYNSKWIITTETGKITIEKQ